MKPKKKEFKNALKNFSEKDKRAVKYLNKFAGMKAKSNKIKLYPRGA